MAADGGQIVVNFPVQYLGDRYLMFVLPDIVEWMGPKIEFNCEVLIASRTAVRSVERARSIASARIISDM